MNRERLLYINGGTNNIANIGAEKVLFKQYSNNTCSYCGRKTTGADKTVDHKTPIFRGGLDSPSNYVVSCKACNSQKDIMTEEEYANFRKVTANLNRNIKLFIKEDIITTIRRNKQINWTQYEFVGKVQRFLHEKEIIKEVPVTNTVVKEVVKKVPVAEEVYYVKTDNVVAVEEEMVNINTIKISDSMRNSINNLTPNNKKVSGIVGNAMAFDVKKPLRLYNGHLISTEAEYYSYKYVLKLTHVPVIHLNLEDLKNKELRKVENGAWR